MKFVTAIVLTALLSFAIGLFQSVFPWWSFVVCSLVVGIVIHQKPSKAFLAGFVALFVLWVILAAIVDMQNEHILSKKVAEILHLGSSVLLIVVTGIIGGLLSGLAALTGSYARKK